MYLLKIRPSVQKMANEMPELKLSDNMAREVGKKLAEIENKAIKMAEENGHPITDYPHWYSFKSKGNDVFIIHDELFNEDIVTVRKVRKGDKLIFETWVKARDVK